jgi:hypothetical protein
MAKNWKQERPTWCPHTDCHFLRRVTDKMCGGKLPKAEPHDGDFNTHRICLNGVLSSGEVFNLQVNNSDLWWFAWLIMAMRHDIAAVEGRGEQP